ncbi:MAG: 1-acyl-sn-glycerol-3-phosphate acyltransferase [Tenericutes bacterium]|nr:1-acyl-sn-glycerol-3-phosphate acyltransferase [Mycoplasmatota bacterium]
MKYYNFKNLKEDEHVFHMWEPLKFKIKDNYKYIPTSFIFNLFSKIALIPIGIILFIFNKIFFGYKITNRDKLVKDTGVVSVSNHIHPLDCTFIGLIYYPRSVYYPTIERNFKIPVIRHLIRLLHAFPIPSDKKQKVRFYEQIDKALKNNKTIQMYPEGSMWPYYDKVRSFKYGAFKMAVKAGVGVQPIKFVFREPDGIYRLYKRKPCIEAVILDPIYPDLELGEEKRIEDLREKVYNCIRGD